LKSKQQVWLVITEDVSDYDICVFVDAFASEQEAKEHMKHLIAEDKKEIPECVSNSFLTRNQALKFENT